MRDKFIGSLILGAIGDALGYVIEFDSLLEIKESFGDNGIEDLIIDKNSGKALISDDTQMTLFTADGMIWAYTRCSEKGIGTYAKSEVYQSYLRWLYTQTGVIENKYWLKKQEHEINLKENNKSILEYKELYALRAPGNSCLTALESGQAGTIDDHINNSKGCGGVMRVAPVGLFLHKNPKEAFRVGAEIAALTHGHVTGYLSAGALASIIAEIINGKTIKESIENSINILKTYNGYEETIQAINLAVQLSESNKSVTKSIEALGEGWIAEEALAIALYCALKEKNPKKALIISVNHNGDSDSTGAICGNILGAAYGVDSIEESWIEKVELRELIEDMGNRLYDLSKKLV